MSIVTRRRRYGNCKSSLRSSSQFRVLYARKKSTKAQCRNYWRRADALRFLGFIRASIPDLAFAVLEQRPVALGPWREVAS